MGGTFMSLVVLEAVLTGAGVVMFLYRSMLDMQEEDHLILDSAEAHLARGQETIRRKVTVVTRYLKALSIVWGILLVIIFGLWVVTGLNLA